MPLTKDKMQCRMVADFLAALANPLRLRMFCGLQEGRRTVTQLAEYAEITLQNASQHLRLMRDKGAVTTDREGQHVYYAVADPRLIEATRLMRDALVDLTQQKAARSAP